MSYWKETFKIGNVEIPRFIGGPMASFTDSPFRAMVREFSPDSLLYSEITHLNNLIHDADNKALRFDQSERPLNFQVTTNSTEYIEHACEKISASGVDMVDLNIGCPARNVIGSGSGSALMGNVLLLKDVFKLFRKSLAIPFTVKMRAGFKEKNASYVAQLAQDEGVDALVIHPRMQTKKFTGKADFALVSEIKKNLSIPVIFSGNIIDAQSAISCYEQTGVDGLMVSRALCGAPWKLQKLQVTVEDRSFCIGSDRVLEVALLHLSRMLDYYGPHGLYMFRKHLACYLKGGPDASEYRHRLIRLDSVEAVKNGLKVFFRTRSE